MNNWFKEKAHLNGNPFTPSGTGLPDQNALYISDKLKAATEKFFSVLSTGTGAKTFPLIGSYGSGKTAFMKGFLTEFFWKKKIKAFYIENPGVNFYDIANRVLQSIGRYEFSKALFEISSPYLRIQKTLLGSDYDTFLQSLKNKVDRDNKIGELQKILLDKGKVNLCDNESVAYSFAKMVIETKIKPYLDYRDFVSDGRNPSVPKDMEAKYFNALITAINRIYGTDGVAFLLDEFEDLTLGARISQHVRLEYLATFRRLIDESENQNLWIVLAMVPGVEAIISKLNPPLWQRFSHHEKKTLRLEELEQDEIGGMIIKWLDTMRTDDKYRKKFFPFKDDIGRLFTLKTQFRMPRVIVKTCFNALAKASQDDQEPPLEATFVRGVMEEFYPQERDIEDKNR